MRQGAVLACAALLLACSPSAPRTSTEVSQDAASNTASIRYEVQALNASGDVRAAVEYLDANGHWRMERVVLPWTLREAFGLTMDGKIGLDVRTVAPVSEAMSLQCEARVLPADADDPYDERVVGSAGQERCKFVMTAREALSP